MAHNFPSDFPSVEVASGVMSMLLTHLRFYSVVARAKAALLAVTSSTRDPVLPASGRLLSIRRDRTTASADA